MIQLFQQHPNRRFKAREIAAQLIAQYPEDYEEKRANPRFADEKAFVSQVAAEIGAAKKAAHSKTSEFKNGKTNLAQEFTG